MNTAESFDSTISSSERAADIIDNLTTFGASLASNRPEFRAVFAGFSVLSGILRALGPNRPTPETVDEWRSTILDLWAQEKATLLEEARQMGTDR